MPQDSDHEFPKGLDKHKNEIEKAKKFAEAMINNYKKFLELRKSARQKKKDGKVLTDEEKGADSVKDIGGLNDWIHKKKESEGYKPRTAGTTDAFGNKDIKTPKPTTPFEEFEEYLTDKVHEPSHIEGNKKVAKEVGLDWDKWTKYGEVRKKREKQKAEGKDDGLTLEELQTLAEGIMALMDPNSPESKYLEKLNDPERVAEEEIGEYEAENAVRDRFLKQNP